MPAGAMTLRRGSTGGMPVLSNALGAIVRAFLVMLLIATPGLMLPPDADTAQMTVLVCLFAGGIVLTEYLTVYPGFIAFRDAAPVNRIRFLAVFTTVFGLCTIMQMIERDGTSLAVVLAASGRAMAALADFPGSPARLMADALDPHVGAGIAGAMTGWAMIWALLSLAVYVAAIHVLRWPGTRGELNLWVNLPLFDPSGGGDVADRLRRNAGVNFLLGALLPFAVPFLVLAAAPALWSSRSGSEQMAVWVVAAWAMLPLICWMRGLACLRIADSIDLRRRAVHGRACAPL